MPSRFDSFKASDQDRARVLRAGIAANPADAEALRKLGFLLSGEGHPDQDRVEAVECLSRAVELGVSSADVGLRLGDLLMERRDYCRAQGAYAKALEAEPTNVRALRGLGLALLRQGRPGDARGPLRIALELQRGQDSLGIGSTLKDIYTDLAAVALQSGSYDESISNCREAITLDARNVRTLVLLAKALLASGKLIEAERVARDAATLSPSNWEPAYLCARSLGDSGKLADADAEYQRILARKDCPAEVHYHYGILCQRADRSFEAVEQFRAALALEPGMPEARSALRALTAHTEAQLAGQHRAAEHSAARAHAQLASMASWGLEATEEYGELSRSLRQVAELIKLGHYYAFEEAEADAERAATRAEEVVRQRRGQFEQQLESARLELQEAIAAALAVKANRYFTSTWHELERRTEQAKEAAIVDDSSNAEGRLDQVVGLVEDVKRLTERARQFHDAESTGGLADVVKLLSEAVDSEPDNPDLTSALADARNRFSRGRRRSRAIGISVLTGTLLLSAASLAYWHLTTGRLLIAASPEELKSVSVDGRRIAATGQFRLKRGPHVVAAVAANGFADSSITVEVPGGGTTTLSLRLRPVFGSLSVNSRPQGAVVLADYSRLGTTPLRAGTIRAGNRSIVLEKPGYRRTETQLEVKRDQLNDLGVINLKGLAGTWTGPGSDTGSAWTLRVSQDGDKLSVGFHYRYLQTKPSAEAYIEGTLTGEVQDPRVSLSGTVTNHNWTIGWVEMPGLHVAQRAVPRSKQHLLQMEGTVSEEWDVLAGTGHFANQTPWSWKVSRSTSDTPSRPSAPEAPQGEEAKVQSGDGAPPSTAAVRLPYPQQGQEKRVPSGEIAKPDVAVLFRDDFSDNSLSKWTKLSGDWSVVDGMLAQNSLAMRKACMIVSTEGSWRDYALEVRVRKVEGNEGFYIGLRYRDQKNALVLNVGQGGNSYLSVLRYTDVLADKYRRLDATRRGFRVEAGRWYKVRAEVRGGTVRCYIDETLVADCSDPDASLMSPSSILLGTWETKVQFDDLKVTVLK